MSELVTKLVGSGRYIQGENALSLIGREVQGKENKVFLMGGKNALAASLPTIEPALKEAGNAYLVKEFSGFCTKARAEENAQAAKDFGADVIVGIGGGRCMDNAKCVAAILGKRLILAPTISATCAAFATLSVMYKENGEWDFGWQHDKEADVLLVDTAVLAKSPIRYTASGIGDAMAKYPEITFTGRYFAEENNEPMANAAGFFAKYNFDLLLEKGVKAIEDIKAGKITKDVEEVLCISIALTGMASGLVIGTKQLGIGHGLYNAICGNYPEQQKNFLHGEMVALGLLVQYKVNGYTDQQLDDMIVFYQKMGLPTKLSDMGMEPTDDLVKTIAGYIFRNGSITEPDMQAQIIRAFDVIR